MAGPCPKIVSILALRVTPNFIGFSNHFFSCSSTDKNHNWITRTHFHVRYSQPNMKLCRVVNTKSRFLLPHDRNQDKTNTEDFFRISEIRNILCLYFLSNNTRLGRIKHKPYKLLTQTPMDNQKLLLPWRGVGSEPPPRYVGRSLFSPKVVINKVCIYSLHVKIGKKCLKMERNFRIVKFKNI